MIYINISNQAPVVFIPSNGWKGGLQDLILSVRNTTDGRHLVLNHTGAAAAGFLISMVLELPKDFGAGEWKYTFTAEGNTIATGLMVAYSAKVIPTTYESENKIIQYEG